MSPKITRMEERKTHLLLIKHLRVGKIGYFDQLEVVDVVRAFTYRDVGAASRAVSTREKPNIAGTIDRQHRVVMGIVGFLIQQGRRTWHHARAMVEIGHHVHEFVSIRRRAPIAEKCFIHFRNINSKRIVVGRSRCPILRYICTHTHCPPFHSSTKFRDNHCPFCKATVHRGV